MFSDGMTLTKEEEEGEWVDIVEVAVVTAEVMVDTITVTDPIMADTPAVVVVAAGTGDPTAHRRGVDGNLHRDLVRDLNRVHVRILGLGVVRIRGAELRGTAAGSLEARVARNQGLRDAKNLPTRNDGHHWTHEFCNVLVVEQCVSFCTLIFLVQLRAFLVMSLRTLHFAGGVLSQEVFIARDQLCRLYFCQ